ncbi:MAG: DivIVA domain-containing protein [Clostridia bacterium]|nr:DivIVA domain-containing protein [Clostridia bacterium]
MNRDEIINKVFPHSLFGYDPVAVDAFLDEVIREFDRMTNTIDVMQFRLAKELADAKLTNECLIKELQRAGFLERAEKLLEEAKREKQLEEEKREEQNAETAVKSEE